MTRDWSLPCQPYDSHWAPRHRAHTIDGTHTQRAQTDAIHRQAYESACTHLRAQASRARWSAQASSSMHTIRLPPWMFEDVGVDRNDYYFVFYLRCFVLLVQKVKADSKQTNNKSESGGGGGGGGGGYGGLSRQQTFEWETRDTWLVNSHWHDKPGKIHIRKIFIHSFTSNRIVLPSCALLSLLHLYIKQQHVFFSLSTPFTSLTIC